MTAERRAAAAISAAARLIERLRDPGRYPHPADAVELVETHISWVLLAGEYAYKFKKPLELGFLDFSTLEKRRASCEEEIRLNRRTAPGVYLDVVRITGSVEHPRIGGAGAAIEHAVRMRRFDQERLADRVARRGALGPADIDAMARAIADFHSGIERAGANSPFGEPEHVHAPTRQNFDQIEALVSDRADVARLERLRRWCEAEHQRIRPLLAERRQAGFVRECHGDLHMGNIVLMEDGPMPFDCIEFNPELRWIDVMNEIAFLVMDLLDHRLSALAWRFLNAYLEATGDYDGVKLLRYYLVYRAMVRAKVATLRAHQPGLEGGARAALESEYRGYLDLAARLAEEAHPAIAIMHGVSGTGKTTVSQTILERLGAIRVRSDIERKRLHGLEAAARSGSAPGGGIYDAAANRATYDRLAQAAGAVASAGFPALADATFLQRAERERLRALGGSLAVPFAIVSCQASEAELRARVASRAREARDASEAGIEVLERQLGAAEPLAPEERAYTVIVDTERLPAALEAAIAGLDERLALGRRA